MHCTVRASLNGHPFLTSQRTPQNTRTAIGPCADVVQYCSPPWTVRHSQGVHSARAPPRGTCHLPGLTLMQPMRCIPSAHPKSTGGISSSYGRRTPARVHVDIKGKRTPGRTWVAATRRQGTGTCLSYCVPVRVDVPPCGSTRRRPSLLQRGTPRMCACADGGRHGSFFGTQDRGQAVVGRGDVSGVLLL